MKLSVLAMASVFAFSGAALAQNGVDLGHSMPGSKAGVPYPNPATDAAAPPAGTAAPAHHHHHGKKHHHHHHHKK